LPLALLAGRGGADLRISLNVLFQEHAFLIAVGMQAAGNSRLDEQIGVSSLLDQNATTLAGIVGAVKGQAAAQALLDAWRAQTVDLLAHAQGQQSSALTDLDARRATLAAQLALGDFSSTQADDALERRLQAQLGLADSVVAQDQGRASQQLGSLLGMSDDISQPLAAAMAAQLPDLVPSATEGADVDVRLHLANSITSHLLLTAAALEAAGDGRAADAQVYTAAASASAADIARQIDLSLAAGGSGTGEAIADRLNGQTAAFVAAAGGADRRQAADDIDRLRGEMDTLLAKANPLLPPGLLNQQLRASDQPLLTASDSFAARDYATAFARVHEAVRQVQKPAETLAVAMIDRYPGRYLALAGTPAPLRKRR
jgi:hypothetical protein